MTADAGVARPSRRSAPAPLACQLEPDRWFDRTHRTYTLQQCLACPARRWCAEQALRYKPISGMWAGIWIDGQFDRAARYLRAIAADVPLRHGPTAPPEAAETPPLPAKTFSGNEAASAVTTAPARTWPTPDSVRAAVAARSSGHCELMAPGCHYTAAAIISRLTGPGATLPECPSLVFEACRSCAITLSRCDPAIARRGGYVIGGAHDGPVTPFYWRQTRWALLTPSGHLVDAVDTARSA